MSRRAKLTAEIYSTAGKSILKLRAFEMVLMLFYVEDLKRAVVESIRSTPRTAAQLPDGIKDLHKKAWKVLVRDNIITETEREDVEQLIEYRNVIAHQVHHLTSDVGEFAEDIHPKYKPDALASLAKYRKKIIDRLAGRYVLSLSFRGLLFQTAEKTYKEELKRLRRKVGKQVAKAKREIDRANTAMPAIPTALRDELCPGHPRHSTRNGSLSRSGVKCCRLLFDAGATSLAVAHMMGVSVATARKHRRAWELESRRRTVATNSVPPH